MTAENYVQIMLAIIALVGSVLGAIIGYWGKSKKQTEIDSKREQSQNDKFEMILDRMKSIETRLDEHNHYAEKFSEIQKNIAILVERQDSTNKSIDRIQKDIDFLKSDRCKL